MNHTKTEIMPIRTNYKQKTVPPTDPAVATAASTTTTSASPMILSSSLESLNPVDVLASIQARVSSDQLDRMHSRSMGLREMMRRATVARNISGSVGLVNDWNC